VARRCPNGPGPENVCCSGGVGESRPIFWQQSGQGHCDFLDGRCLYSIGRNQPPWTSFMSERHLAIPDTLSLTYIVLYK
jgi:hypothetical protein